ncbi:MAG: hypothetical protein ACK4SR_01045 [Thiobacillus sp.]
MPDFLHVPRAGLQSSDTPKPAWDAASLDRWRADPEKFVPGQRMLVKMPDVATLKHRDRMGGGG